MRLLPAIMLGVACSSPTAPEPVAFARLSPEKPSFEFSSGVTQKERVVIRDADAWSALWARIYMNRSPVPVLPAVDFSREMIVAVSMGARESTGYNIFMTGARIDAGSMVVDVVSQSPGRNCFVLTVITEPVDLARVQRFNGDVRFEERDAVFNCG